MLMKTELVRYVLQHGPVGRRRLMKLLFLIDWELCRRFGSAVFRWRMYKYGPTSREVLHILDDMEEDGSATARAADDDIIYELAPAAPPAELPPEVEEVADQIIEMWMRRSLGELAEYANRLLLESIRDTCTSYLLCRLLSRHGGTSYRVARGG
jgi:hypothetical protein